MNQGNKDLDKINVTYQKRKHSSKYYQPQVKKSINLLNTFSQNKIKKENRRTKYDGKQEIYMTIHTHACTCTQTHTMMMH